MKTTGDNPGRESLRTNPEPEDLPEAVMCILLEVGSSGEHGSREGRPGTRLRVLALPLEGAT